MQTIEVTDEQHAFIQRLRQELSEQVVGKYGHVRERDAIQFLIDNFDGDLEVEAELAVDAEAAGDGETTADGGEAITYEEEDEAEDDGAGEAGEDDESEADTDSDDGGDAADADDSSDDDDADDGDESDDDAGGSAADDDDMLDRMMNLLETHDDKWEESPSADYRYRVTLPDGTTEDVQTKDDVRALLFKNY